MLCSLPPMASSVTILLVLSTLLTAYAQQLPAQTYCPNELGNFTSNSTFQSNLNTLLTSLASNASSTGYYETTIGSIPDRIYGLGQCFVFAEDPDTCRTCLSTATRDILEWCPFLKDAIIWYDYCMLRYSSRRFSGVLNPWKMYKWNVNNVTSEWPRFNESLFSLTNKITRYAAYNTSAVQPMYATGQIAFNEDYPKIYAQVFCTRDLSVDNCNRCLKELIGDLPACCNHKIGGAIVAINCFLRYEVGVFYNGTSTLSLPAIATTVLPAPEPAPSTTPSTNSTSVTENQKKRMGTILAISISLGFFVILSLGGCICWKIRNNAHKRYERTEKQESPLIESLLLDLSTIRKITNNFSESNKLGEGGFGGVYKGELEDGQEVAVKRLSRGSSQGINELKNEVVLLAKLQHRNLVRLLGVCLEEEERILLYEYAQNKSLDKVLFDPNRKGQLNWERRYKIIGGIARGLLYLHEESQVKIIHRDLKASNILLDSDMNPKISDFGLARLFGGDQTQANTSRVAGTIGYMPPEYAMGGNYSSKSDVYGFGVLVLEIVTGRKNSDCFTSEDSIGLLSYVWEHWSMRRVQHIIDASFGRNYSASEALRCIQIGLLCVQKSPADRPTLSTVVLMLSSQSVTIVTPTRPAFLASSSIISFDLGNNTNSSEQRQSTTRSVHSQNELSITELDPR